MEEKLFVLYSNQFVTSLCFNFSKEEINNSRALSLLFTEDKDRIRRYEFFDINNKLFTQLYLHYENSEINDNYEKIKKYLINLLDEEENYTNIFDVNSYFAICDNIYYILNEKLEYIIKKVEGIDNMEYKFKLIIKGLRDENAVNIFGKDIAAINILDKYNIRGRNSFNIKGDIEINFTDEEIHENDLLYKLFTKCNSKVITLELLKQVTIDNLFKHPISKLINLEESIKKNAVVVINSDLQNQFKLFMNTVIDNINIDITPLDSYCHISLSTNRHISVRSEFGFILRDIILEALPDNLAEIISADENLLLKFKLRDIDKFTIYSIFIDLNKLKFKINDDFKLVEEKLYNNDITIDMSDFYDSLSNVKAGIFEEFFKKTHRELSGILNDNSFRLLIKFGKGKILKIHSTLFFDIIRNLKYKTLEEIVCNLEETMLPSGADKNLLYIYKEFFTSILSDKSKILIIFDKNKLKNYILYPAYKNVCYRMSLKRFYKCLDVDGNIEGDSSYHYSSLDKLNENYEFIDL